MANEQPAPTAAPEPGGTQAPAQEPAQQPAAQPSAEPTPTNSPMDTLSDEAKSYLKSQGIEDISNPESLTKIINHTLSLKKTSSETAAELNRIKSTVSGQPVSQGEGGEAKPDSQPHSDAAATRGLDPVTAFNLATSLALQFPALKDDLTTGQFYTDLEKSGRSLVDSQGNVNLSAIQSFGAERQRVVELEQKLAEFEKPNANSIPDANPTTPTQPADDAPMNKQLAYAIASQDTSHARYKEAIEFLQKSVN